jgi:hypothetical protein
VAYNDPYWYAVTDDALMDEDTELERMQGYTALTMTGINTEPDGILVMTRCTHPRNS